MKQRQVVLAGLGVAVVVAVIWILVVNYAANLGFGSNSGAGTNRGRSTVHFIDIQDQSGSQRFAYVPQTTTVKVGTTVGWRNLTQVAHTVTSDGAPPVFDSGPSPYLLRAHRYFFTFEHPGTYRYHCVVHPYMTGTVIVTA